MRGMQNSTTITPSTTTSTTGSDPRPHLRSASETALRVVEGVTADQLRLPTPCSEFDVEQLLAHLAFAVARVAEAGRGDEIAEPAEPMHSTDWHRDLRTLVAEADAAWNDDARLDASIELPWATLTGAETVAVYVNEITVHTWDLATATGQEVEWDDDVVALAHTSMLQQLPVADRDPMWAEFLAGAPEGFAFAPPFANAQPTAEDASPIERLLAWNGRSVRL